jgi:hypothetical protein
MKRTFSYLFVVVVFLTSCTETSDDQGGFISEITKITTLFDEVEFESDTLKNLLGELNICFSEEPDTIKQGEVPCSPEYFKFYTYNRKRPVYDAFMLQVRKGVNNYPFRRLLIFVRERGQLVLVSGVNGYIVEKRTTPNEIDDLVVAVVDNVGGHYERYDVLLQYKEGKYHYVEAIGDLQGKFEEEDLKERATEMIGKRIKEKNLIF